MERLRRLNKRKRRNFDFGDLVSKYSHHPVIRIEEAPGFHDPTQGGAWVPGNKREIELENAAIVPLKQEELVYGEGGTYGIEDRKLYCYTKMAKGDYIKHKGKGYRVHNRLDYEDFDEGLFIYFVVKEGDFCD